MEPNNYNTVMPLINKNVYYNFLCFFMAIVL
jgi:hypothetical protein